MAYILQMQPLLLAHEATIDQKLEEFKAMGGDFVSGNFSKCVCGEHSTSAPCSCGSGALSGQQLVLYSFWHRCCTCQHSDCAAQKCTGHHRQWQTKADACAYVCWTN